MADRPLPLVELSRTRVLEFIREPEAIFWVFVFPVLLAAGLGIAFRSRPAEMPRAAVVAGDEASSWVAEALQKSGRVEVMELGQGAADQALRTGKVDVEVKAAGPASSPRVIYRYDPQRSDSRTARALVDDVLQRAFGRTDQLAARDEPVTQPGDRYIDFLIPGLIGLNLMGSGLWGVGFSLVLTRTRNLLKRFAVTPMRRSQFLLSYALSRLVFLVLEVAALVGFGWLAFDVSVHGSFVALTVVVLLGGATFSGVGLLLAARPKTVEGVSGWMNLVMLPMWVVSGSFFSYHRFPDAVQPVIRALPLTALNDALRAVVNDGAPLLASWRELLIMGGWGLVCFVIALRIFRWK
jgi:ABC-2 type transport system permease protein